MSPSWRLIIWLLLAVIPLPATASDGLEFIPFVGYRFGGHFNEESTGDSLDVEDGNSWGLILSLPLSDKTRYEFLYSHQDTRLGSSTTPEETFDLDIHYFQVGGTLDITHDRFIPFFSGGIGMAHLSPGRSGFSNETRLSLSLGGGLKWYPTEQLGIRFEMRGYGTLMESSGSLFCDGGCDLRISGDMFPQFETNLGLIFRF
jgi:opacity protein-like surface antigen